MITTRTPEKNTGPRANLAERLRHMRAQARTRGGLVLKMDAHGPKAKAYRAKGEKLADVLNIYVVKYTGRPARVVGWFITPF